MTKFHFSVLMLVVGLTGTFPSFSQSDTTWYEVTTIDEKYYVGAMISKSSTEIVLFVDTDGYVIIPNQDIQISRVIDKSNYFLRPIYLNIQTADNDRIRGILVSARDDVFTILSDKGDTLSIPLDEVISLKESRYQRTNPQTQHYIMQPNSLGMKKGEASYQNGWLIFNQVNYAVTDYFVVGTGLALLPSDYSAWVSPRFNIPLLTDWIHMGVGAIAGRNIAIGKNFLAPIGQLTFGDQELNASAGVGYLDLNIDLSSKWVYSISGMAQLKRQLRLVTENYYANTAEGFTLITSVGLQRAFGYFGLDLGFYYVMIPEVNESDSAFNPGIYPWIGFTIPMSFQRN